MNVDTAKRLSKYEAKHIVQARIGADPSMELLSPFGPLIGRTRLPDETVAHLNSEADRILKPGQGSEFQVAERICRASRHCLMDCVA